MTVDDLLEKLSTGDPAAAEQVFQEYEPYLRLLVRRQLPANMRGKFDSIDIVQSVWAHLLDGMRTAGWRFQDANHLRAFLIQVTRNRFIDQLRKQGNVAAHEQSLQTTDPQQLPPTAQDSASQLAQAEDLWQQLLGLCEPRHHQLLSLKRQGMSIGDIATATGLHPSSVRRIFYDLARLLAAEHAKNDASAN